MLSIFSSPIFIVGATVTFLFWFCYLTYLVLRDRKLYSHLAGSNEKKSISELFSNLKKELEENRQNWKLLEQKIKEEEKKNERNFQKIGLVRFNPYSDTGGQQSFTMAILDSKDNGMIFSHLYGRSGSRWFVKRINEGKSEDIDLTDEEKKAIVIAN